MVRDVLWCCVMVCDDMTSLIAQQYIQSALQSGIRAEWYSEMLCVVLFCWLAINLLQRAGAGVCEADALYLAHHIQHGAKVIVNSHNFKH